jgi:D-alanyl-D-alanine carboxypeptidase
VKLLKVLFLTCFLAALVLAQSDPNGIANAWAKEGGFMGSVLLAKDGKIVLEKGYGFANLEWDVPNTPDTKFRLGSITKQFTATAILQLIEADKLHLEDPACNFIPECPESWKPVTIHHLLNHTSGIPSYTGLPGFFTPKQSRIPLSPLEVVMLTKGMKLDFQPGEDWKYNNTGYVLLGHIIEKVSGVKYDAYLKEHIFDPLDMKDSGYDWTRPVQKRRASGYLYNRTTKEYTNADYLDMSLPHAAGSLYSTARDLYKWDRALAAGKLLKKESFERMFTPGKKGYGFGWVIETAGGRQAIGHGGGINGFSTMIMRYPQQNALVVVLSNVANGNADGLARYLGRSLFGEKVEFPWDRKAVDVDPAVFSRYAGVYALEPFQVTVSVEDGKLMFQTAGQPKVQLFAESETRWFLRVVEASVEFLDGEMILRQAGSEFKGKRLP